MDDCMDESYDALVNTALQERDDGRRLVNEYSKVMKKLDENKEEDNPEASNRNLRQLMKDCDRLQHKVKRPNEAVADAGCFVKIAGRVREQCEQISKIDQTKINVSDFVYKLSNKIDCDVEDGVLQASKAKWCDFGRAVSGRFARAPSLSYLYGSIEKGAVDAKKKRASVPRAHAQRMFKSEPATAVTQKVVEQKEEESVEALVKATYRGLLSVCQERATKRIGFWELVIDPNSFSQTVENIFHTTFLVKERKAILILGDEENSIDIQPIRKSRGTTSSENIDSDQFIMDFNVQKWKDIKKELGVKRALLPKSST